MASDDTCLPTPPQVPVGEGEKSALPKPKRKFSSKNEKDRELIRLALHKSPFFTCLDEEQVERFIQAAELRIYAAGQFVIIEGCVDDLEVDQAQDRALSLSPRSKEWRGDREDNDSDAALRGVGHESHSSRQESNETGAAVTEGGFVLVERRESEQGRGHSNVAQFTTSGPPKEEESMTKDSSSDQDTSRDPLVAISLVATTAETDVGCFREDTTSQHYLEPPPPRSGTPSYIFIIKSGQADVMYSHNVNPASLGTGTVFGEGGFLFGRQHSASVMAAPDESLECYVVDAATFRNYVLPSDNMTKLYQNYAIHVDEESNSRYMTMQDFVDSCLEPLKGRKHQGNTADVSDTPIQDPLAGVGIANTFNLLRNGQARGAPKFSQQRISLSDFCLFHLLMARPDPEVDITFLLMDERKRGVIYKEDIANFVKSSLVDDFMFDMNSEFIYRHFGKDMKNIDARQQHHQRGIRPHQFSQFLVDLRREIGQQIFLQEVEKNGTPEGYLPPTNFVRVLKKACGWRLPEGVADRLDSIYRSDPVSVSEADKNHRYDGATHSRRLVDRYFSYCDFLAFQEVLGQLSGICNLIDRAEQIKKSPLSTDDFKVANRVLGMGGRLSRRQVDIIFQLFDLDEDGFVSHEDTVAVAGAEIAQRIDAVAGRHGALTFAPPPEYRHDADRQEMGTDVFFMLLQNFSLTSIAGCIGVIALAPLDLVKTRLMNERVPLNGSRMYRNSFDCLKIAVVSEGYFGLYRGLLPQLIGVAPEKALKLAVNDLLNHSMGVSDPGQPKTALHFLQEMLAGGCAGACQLLVTNPIEIVKIRMQLQGETARLLKTRGFENPVPQSLTAVVKNLGSAGLFTGARACLLRDIPFGAIYFPTYALLKESLSTREGPTQSISASNLLLAGTVAAFPASFLTTPADVIKTRLQVIPRPLETGYDGIRDCFTKVYKLEGPAAFFKGAAMRVAKISPQFGISLVAYEQLSQLLGAKGLLTPTTVPVDPNDYWEAFPTRAIKNKTDDTDGLLKNLGSRSLRPPSKER